MSAPSHGQRLAGMRVLVPRPRERAEQLCFLLEDEGAEVLAVPLLELLAKHRRTARTEDGRHRVLG